MLYLNKANFDTSKACQKMLQKVQFRDMLYLLPYASKQSKKVRRLLLGKQKEASDILNMHI
jgi:hypothetical protein